jgi:type I restriction enzyme S subunit
MSRYKAYPEYRDSGIVWHGRVPAHWVPKRFKQVLADKKKAFNPSLEAGSISFGRVVFKDSDNLSQETKDSYQEVLSGEYLVNPLNLNYDLLSLRTALSEIDVVVSTGYIVLKSTGVLKPRYIRWLLHEFDVSHMKTLGAGVRQTINYSDIGNSYFCAPAETEQEAISTFLDYEAAKIDALIEKQQQLIELLKEKRQAVISRAVTKGLNPNAPMKDSGVEWMGQVPKHWKTGCIGYYAQISSGATPDRNNPAYWNGDIPWVKTGEVKYEEIFESEEHISEDALCNSSVKLSPPGTVLMAMYGQGVTRGRVALLGVPATYNQACAAITPSAELLNHYLIYFFMGAYHAIRDGGNETSQMNLNAEIVGKFKVTIPPLNEQHQIVTHLKPTLVKFDSMINRAESAILLMQERRTALISAAVTGKIDVRDWQAAA